MRRHRQDLEVFSEMNLTNMLDTAFVLLLAFLLVAPMIKQGIELQLPATNSGTLNTEIKTITIAIGSSPGAGLPDRIYIEDQRVTIESMPRIIQERRALYPKLSVLVEADRKVTYETFAQVMAALKAIGIEDIGLPTEPVVIQPGKPTPTTPDDKEDVDKKGA
jgi:biopolymer transport protein ExbD